MNNEPRLDAGVIGVGVMGEHHARVYNELPDVTLACVTDADDDQAEAIASKYSTAVCDTESLIERVDIASIAVPTPHHYDLATACIDAGVDVLVEKPLVDDPEKGRELIRRAEREDVTLQVGHIERHNPVVSTLQDIVPELNVIAIEAERLGPKPDRQIYDSAVVDLMIHDIDVVCSLLDEDVQSVEAIGTADGRHATATLEFDDETVGTLTASRVTQQKQRKLSITAEDCYVTCDYIDQSIEIHRQSVPEFVTQNGDVHYRHESVVENPAVANGEPLKYELSSFVESCQNGTEPAVTGTDGLQALELARTIDRKAFDKTGRARQVVQE